jgi:hypothetical protein
MSALDRETAKDLPNSLLYWLTRPLVAAAAALFLLFPSTALLNAFESGADFLNIGAGARASAMGSAYAAAAGDASSVYYNPGALAGARREVSLMHSAWALDGSYDFAAAALPLDGFTAGVSFTRLDHGGLEGRAADGSSSGGFGASDRAVGLALARSFGGFSAGAGVKFLNSTIAGVSASAVAFDFGASKKISGAPLRLGLAVRNLGSGPKFLEKREALPTSVSAGAAFELAPGFALAGEITRMVHEKTASFAAGTEYSLPGGLALRGGYAAAGAASGAVSGGVGFSAGNMKLDYSFAPFGELDTTRRFSVSMAF